MEIKWEPQALWQIEQIIDYYLAVAGERIAIQLSEKIDKAVTRLITFPSIGFVEPGLKGLKYTYRSILVRPHYKVIYRTEGEIVYIIMIWDCRQDPEKLLKAVENPLV